MRSPCTRSIITASMPPARVCVEVVADGCTATRWTPMRQQRRRGHHGDLGAEGAQQPEVGAGHPGVQDVADDRDLHAGQVGAQRMEVPLTLGPVAAQRERVQQRLGGVFVGAVAGVDHRCVDPVGGGQPGRGAGGPVPDDDGVGADGLQASGRCP